MEQSSEGSGPGLVRSSSGSQGGGGLTAGEACDWMNGCMHERRGECEGECECEREGACATGGSGRVQMGEY